MSRVKRSAFNVASTGIFAIITTLAALFCTPMLLRWLGSEQFGLYRLLLDWFGYVTILDLGLGASVGACVAWALEQPEESLRKVISTSVRAYLRITALMLAGASLFVIFLPFILPPSKVPVGQIRWAGALILLPLALTPLTTFRALAEARQRGYIVNLLLTGQAVLNTLLLLLMARRGYGLVGQAIATTIAALPTPVILTFMALRANPGLVQSPPDKEVGRRLQGMNGPNLILNLSGRLSLLSDNIVVGAVMGSFAVAPFFLTQRLAALVQSQLLGIGSSTWSALIQLYNRGLNTLFLRRLCDLTHFVSSLAWVAIAPIIAFNRHFIVNWIGKSDYAGDAVTVICCFNIWMGSLFSLWLWPIVASGHSRLWARYAVVSTILNVIVSVAATFALGWAGPLIGTLISYIAVSVWAIPKILQQVFNVPPQEVWLTALRPLRWGVPYTFALWLIASNYQAPSWPFIGIEMCSGICGALGLFWFTGMNPNQRHDCLSQARAVFSTQ